MQNISHRQWEQLASAKVLAQERPTQGICSCQSPSMILERRQMPTEVNVAATLGPTLEARPPQDCPGHVTKHRTHSALSQAWAFPVGF